MAPSFDKFFSRKEAKLERRGFFPTWASKNQKKKKRTGNNNLHWRAREERKWQTEQRQSDGRRGNYSWEQALFSLLEPICFLEMLLSFNKSLIRRITRNPPAAARWLQLKQAPSSLFILRPHSADVWSSPTLNHHRSPITQQKSPSPLFFSARDKARSKDASGARDELAQIVSKRLVCLGYLGVFFFPLTEEYRLFKVIISFTKSLSRIQLLWAIWGKNKSPCNSADGPSAWCINISKII